MTKRTKIIAGTLGLACLALTGCVSEGGGYYGGGYSGYDPIYERDHDGPDRYWRYRRDRDRDHRGGWHDGRSDRGDHGRYSQSSRNQAAYDRDKPNPTWAGSGARGRDNGPDRSGGGRQGGHDILIPNQ